jgi:hypothetical protein
MHSNLDKYLPAPTDHGTSAFLRLKPYKSEEIITDAIKQITLLEPMTLRVLKHKYVAFAAAEALSEVSASLAKIASVLSQQIGPEISSAAKLFAQMANASQVRIHRQDDLLQLFLVWHDGDSSTHDDEPMARSTPWELPNEETTDLRLTGLLNGSVEEPSREQLADYIMALDQLIEANRISTISRLIIDIDPERTSATVLIATLRGTLMIRAMLFPMWEQLRDRTEKALKDRGLDTQKVLRGLK